MKRSLIVTAMMSIFVVGGLASAMFIGVFNQKYNVKKDGNLAKARCGVCHMKTMPKLNPYGEDLKRAMGASKKLTAEILAKVEDKDSDGDGVKNLAEIKADTNPGDKASK